MTDYGKDFPCMLAQANKYLDRIKFPAIAQTKMDGMRANILIEKNNITVYSRNGKEIQTFGRFDGLTDLKNIVLDGELLVVDKNKPLDRKTGNGIINKAIISDKRKTTVLESETEMFKIILWDVIDLDAWKTGYYSEPYIERLDRLKSMKKDNRYGLVNSQTVEDINSAFKLFKNLLKEGQEGLILKNMNMPWEDKRSYDMVKMKEVKEIDLLVVDWVPGTGKYEGMLGALKCRNKDGTIEVNVGSGFLDNDRRELTPKNTIGKICAVKYNDLIVDKTRKSKSLFLPIFQEIRQDKTVPD